LRWLEEKFGRERFDKFVRAYFDKHAFQSITTATFKEYLFENLLNKYPDVVTVAEVNEWVEKAGLPKNAPSPASNAFTNVEVQVKKFVNGETMGRSLMSKSWTTQEWLHFLKSMPENTNAEKMAELDKLFNFTRSGNSEIAFQWLMMSIKNNYRAADARLEEFLVGIGRRKFVRPLFAELAKTPAGMQRAKLIYAKSRPGYHPITQAAIDAIVK
jgi:leukotriene-A4 hydrolase